MESSPYYLPAPYSKGLGISVPTRDRSISGNLNRISVFSFAEQKPTRLSLETLAQSPSEKVISQMKMTSNKFLSKMNEIDQNIANNKLPFIKYYIPGTETFKSKKEISHEIQTSHDFFKSDQSLFKGSKYKPKDFCYCSPRSKSKTPYTPRQIPSTQQFELRSPSENQESQPSAHHAQLSPSHLSPMAAREAYMLKKLTVHDQDEGKVSPNISSTHYTSLEMAPSTFQVHPVEKMQRETEEMVLVQYNKGKIPLSLYEGTVMRRKLIKDIKGGNNNSRILEKQGTSMVKKEDIKQQKPSTADSLNISISGLKKNAEEKQKRLGKSDMITRSPVTNVYYQVLSMTTPNKKAIAAKLKINPNLRRDEIRAERNQ